MWTIWQLIQTGAVGALAIVVARKVWPKLKKLEDFRVQRKKLANGYRFDITWR